MHDQPQLTIPVRPALRLAVLVTLLVAGTTMPGSLKTEIEGQLWSGLPWSALAHFTLFALIASVPVYGSGWRAVLRAMLVALLLALVTEMLQAWIPGRHPMLRDVLIDLAGAGFGLMVRSMK